MPQKWLLYKDVFESFTKELGNVITKGGDHVFLKALLLHYVTYIIYMALVYLEKNA